MLLVLAATLAGFAVAPPSPAAVPRTDVALTPARIAPGGACAANACGATRICHAARADSHAFAALPPRHATLSPASALSYPTGDERTPLRIAATIDGAPVVANSPPIYLATLRLRI